MTRTSYLKGIIRRLSAGVWCDHRSVCVRFQGPTLSPEEAAATGRLRLTLRPAAPPAAQHPRQLVVEIRLRLPVQLPLRVLELREAPVVAEVRMIRQVVDALLRRREPRHAPLVLPPSLVVLSLETVRG